MKKLFYIVILLLGVLIDSQLINAQMFTHQKGDPFMVEKIQEQLNPSLTDFPASVRRISIKLIIQHLDSQMKK